MCLYSKDIRWKRRFRWIGNQAEVDNFEKFRLSFSTISTFKIKISITFAWQVHFLMWKYQPFFLSKRGLAKKQDILETKPERLSGLTWSAGKARLLQQRHERRLSNGEVVKFESLAHHLLSLCHYLSVIMGSLTAYPWNFWLIADREKLWNEILKVDRVTVCFKKAIRLHRNTKNRFMTSI